MPHLEFLNGEKVTILDDGRTGTIHHASQFPGEAWKYVVDFPGGDRGTFLAEQLDHVNDTV